MRAQQTQRPYFRNDYEYNSMGFEQCEGRNNEDDYFMSQRNTYERGHNDCELFSSLYNYRHSIDMNLHSPTPPKPKTSYLNQPQRIAEDIFEDQYNSDRSPHQAFFHRNNAFQMASQANRNFRRDMSVEYQQPATDISYRNENQMYQRSDFTRQNQQRQIYESSFRDQQFQHGNSNPSVQYSCCRYQNSFNPQSYCQSSPIHSQDVHQSAHLSNSQNSPTSATDIHPSSSKQSKHLPSNSQESSHSSMSSQDQSPSQHIIEEIYVDDFSNQNSNLSSGESAECVRHNQSPKRMNEHVLNSSQGKAIHNNCNFSTPSEGLKRRKGKFNARVIDSGHTNHTIQKIDQMSSEREKLSSLSNSSAKFKNIIKQVDLSNIISSIIPNVSSKRRVTRKSTNSLHASFQKRIFDEENDCLNCHKDDIQSQKLKKLVKNKRRSECGSNKQQSQRRSCKSNKETIKSCAICLSIPNETDCGVLECLHEFCFDCILEWSKVTNQCPMCRAKFHAIKKQNINDPLHKQNAIFFVEEKRQRIPDSDEFYWEEASEDIIDEVCYICETDQDEEKLIVCDHCGIRICHTYCDDQLFDDSVPSEDWFCHECRVRSELFT